MSNRTAPAPIKRTQAAPSMLFALLLISMATLQLVTFEDFTNALAGFSLLPRSAMPAFAVTLVVLEIAAVPFTLRLWLSPLTRAVSAVCSLLSPLIWLALALRAQLIGGVSNLGLAGGMITLPSSWWAVIDMLALLALAYWSFTALQGIDAINFRVKKTK